MGMEVLFRHYFTDGLYPDAKNLRLAAEEVGMDDVDAAIDYVVNNRAARQSVMQEAQKASRSGIHGVPHFFINGKGGFSGAQPAEAFKDAFKALAPAATKSRVPVCKDGVC